MIRKVKLSRVFKNTENKEGIPYVYKKGINVGKPFIRVGIKTEQTGDDVYSINAMPDSQYATLEAGQEHQFKMYEENGFKCFKFPTKDEIAIYNQAIDDALNGQ